jgi:sugar phosphate isomerase/epimerase
MTGLANSETVIWLYVTSKNFKPSEVAGDLAVIGDLKNLARKAATHNLKVALYPHSDFWVEKVADAIRLVRKVDEPNFGLTLNVCHALNKGEGDKLENLAAQAADKLFVVTVNGAKRGGKGWSELIMPLDQGDLDLGPLLGQLARQGFKGVIGFQGYGIPGDRRAIHQGTMVAWKRYFAAPN